MEKQRDVLVIGGGIAGMQSALLLAEKERQVYVLETAPAIGGYFPLLDRQFPTNSCGVCFMSPKPPALCPIYEGQFHPKIRLLTNSDVQTVTGEAGNFTVTYTTRPTCVDPAKCTLCGKCTTVCPITVDHHFGEGVEQRKAIYLPFPQAIPRSYVIDPVTCTRCGKCVAACTPGAIDLDAPERSDRLNVGAIVLGFGTEPFQANVKGEFGLGRYPNVLSSIQYERMLSHSGPTKGIPIRPSDGKPARRVAFLECIGSRDRACGHPYCSSVCCMFTAKQAMISKQRLADFAATVFYMDVRAMGKNYERYYESAQRDYDVKYLRCAVSMIHEQKQTHNLLLTYGDETGDVKQGEFDMVVLATGMTPPSSITKIADRLGVQLNQYNFCHTAEFQPTATSKPGIFVAGAFREPRDIPESVVEACSAAADVALLLDRFDAHRQASGPTEPLDEAGLRMGVFVCDQKGLLKQSLQLEPLLAHVRQQPNVHRVEYVDITCPAEGLETILASLRQSDCNRVVLAGYRGLELERRLKFAAPAGRYANAIDVVNIGEQCVDVHQGQPQATQAKAIELITAALRKAWEMNPCQRNTQQIGGGVLVVGGGITGMTSSLTLADQGIPVTLLEKEAELGGLARTAYYTVKGSAIQPLIQAMVAKVESHPHIHVIKAAELKRLEGSWGNFRATIATNGNEQTITHGALILATGGFEHKPTEYLYGQSPYVVTQRELDAILAGTSAQPAPFKLNRLKSIVMIQCVGSRDERHPYCSRVCCSHAVKNALKLKALNPDVNIYVLYRDLRTYGFLEDYYLQAREQGVIFIRYDVAAKPQVTSAAQGVVVKFYDGVAKETMTIDTDALVLSAGVEPQDVRQLAQTVQVQVNADGFFEEPHPKAAPLDARDRGKFFAGLAHSPMLIEEAICQGKAAAERAAVLLWKDTELLPETQSFVREEVCTGCGQCVQVCPYKAISLHPQNGLAVVDAALCRGCGTCAGTCRVQAITIRSFGDPAMLEGLHSVLGALQCRNVQQRTQTDGTNWEPSIIIFLCSWCAAGAADLAGDSQLQYNPGVRLVKVPCVGRLNPLYILHALQKGADGVLVVGCHPQDCHFISGNLVQRRSFGVIKQYLSYLGIESNRVQCAWVSASEGTRFAELLEKMVKEVKQLGPQQQMSSKFEI